MRAFLAAASVADRLAAPLASAHGAPSPDPRHTRLLADWADDCGGDGGARTGSGKGSHDLLALDLRESFGPDLGTPSPSGSSSTRGSRATGAARSP